MATLLSRKHSVTAVDIIPEKVAMINSRQSPVQDDYIEDYFVTEELDLTATLDAEQAYRGAELVIIAAPTNYDPKKNFFDTSAVEDVIETVMRVNPSAFMVIKSTVLSDLRNPCVPRPEAGGYCSVRSSCASPRPCMTIFIRAA